ncbi:MAG: iron-sulfur cluster carrier protein ApbC [Ignavibacteria bacterium]|nr:iron-sulfur cluster carrier protein ApbC [Ignavibacteria bacterium]
MEALNQGNILKALKVVKDPDLQKDIVSLGFIKDLVIRENDVSFSIELTTPACPVKEELKQAAIDAVRKEIKGVRELNVTMSAVVRSTRKEKPAILPEVKNTIAVGSGKGGVGKSTVAVNLAVALAMEGARVGLVDLDVYGPSIPMMMGITGRPVMKEKRIQTLTGHGVSVMSIGFFIDPNQSVVWRGPMASGAVKQFLGDVDWGELDYLVMDLPPGTGDVQLTLSQTVPLTGAVVVTTPQDVSLADARKAYMMFGKVNVPVLGIVENMSFHLCSQCGHRDEVFDHGGGEKEAQKLGVPFLGRIPLTTGIRVGGDRGQPVVLDNRPGTAAADIMQIARAIAAQVSIRNEQADDDVEISLLGEQRPDLAAKRMDGTPGT